jgi:hydrogenase maturation protein HypF
MNTPAVPSRDLERRAFVVTGLVQGVGFRPFVHRLAEEFGLAGFVLNHAGEVHLEVEGARLVLQHFARALLHRAPPRAEIADLRSTTIEPHGRSGFSIVESARDARSLSPPFIAPDIATCDACLDELFAPENRRHRHAFINCSDCGPRLTIIESAPYDRANTTMRGFEPCAACSSEYQQPKNRRFHAEPIACPACGPKLELLDRDGQHLAGDPLWGAAQALFAQRVVAIKGIGGFHLACLASSDSATEELRQRKGRDEKPFALLVRSLPHALELCAFDQLAQSLLTSPARPIVLGRRRDGLCVSAGVAGKSPLLGMMLAYTPLQHLLCRAVGDVPLVMTSGNASHEPIVFEEAEARASLVPMVTCTLTHDRPIELRCDDSVVRSISGSLSTLRRARGLAPRPLTVSESLRRPILALGAHDNATFTLGRTEQVLVSHHLGDLGNARAQQAYRAAITHYERLFAIEPQVLVHDLHPDYASTQIAFELAAERGIERISVQHHHAHVASCMLEHGLTETVLGVACDGAGLGSDGTIWGGEVLRCDRSRFERLAHFRAVPMPGGEKAALEPWRMALAHLLDSGASLSALPNALDERAVRVVTRMIEREVNCPLTSSVGRLFDAVSALCGVCSASSYEGQAAIELEWAASRAASKHSLVPYPFRVARRLASGPLQVDVRPMIREIVSDLRAGTSSALVARRFHATLAAALCELCVALRAETGLGRVVLAGGVFANALLVHELEERLAQAGFATHRAHAYPSGDGGLSLGQLAIAAARDGRGG